MSFGVFDYAAFMVFFAYASGSVVAPVSLVQLARDLGFTLESGGMAAGGALHLGRTIPMVASMLLCGFAAGRWGKRRTFGFAAILMGAGVGLCALAPTYGILFAALLIAGIGEGTIEGLATPFVRDLHPDEPGRYINFSHAFWSIGIVATVLVSGALLSLGVSWRLLTGAVSALAGVPAVILLWPSREGGRKYPEHPEPVHWRTIWSLSARIVKIPRFWLFFAAMFVAGGGEFCLTFWCASYIQLNFAASAWAGGVGTACFAAGMALGRTGWGYLSEQHHLKPLIVISALAGTAITSLFPALTHLWALLGLLFLAGIATRLSGPAYKVTRLTDCPARTRPCCSFYFLAPGFRVAVSSLGLWGISAIWREVSGMRSIWCRHVMRPYLC